MSSKQKTTQTNSAASFAQPGIESASALATKGLGNAVEYGGRFNPQTSPYSTTAATGVADLARSLPSTYGRSALDAGDYLWNKIQSGGYKPATYDPTTAINAAVRPIAERYSEQVIPGMNAMFTANGGYQGGGPGGVASTAGEAIARNFDREIAQAAGEQAFNAAQLNSSNLLQGNAAEGVAIGALPGVYSGGVASSLIPSQLWGQAGGLDEALAGRDITEALAQNNYHNTYESSLAAPYMNLLMGPGQAFGTQTTTKSSDPWAAIIQALAAGAQVAAQAGGFSGAGGAPTSILPNGASPSYGYPGTSNAGGLGSADPFMQLLHYGG